MLKGRGPLGLLLIVAALIALTATPVLAQGGTALTSLLSLSGARLAVVSGGRLVVSMDVDGDLPGLLTLTLRRDASGTTVTGGDWAFVVSTRQPEVRAAEGTATPGAWPALRAGTLSGTVGGGSVRLSGDGGVAEIRSISLSLEAGSLAFEHVRPGHGVADAAGLHDVRASHGTLMLTF